MILTSTQSCSSFFSLIKKYKPRNLSSKKRHFLLSRERCSGRASWILTYHDLSCDGGVVRVAGLLAPRTLDGLTVNLTVVDRYDGVGG